MNKDTVPLLKNDSFKNLSVQDLSQVTNVRYHQRNQEPEENVRFCYTSTFVLGSIWSALMVALVALLVWESSVRFECPPVLLENFTLADIKHDG